MSEADALPRIPGTQYLIGGGLPGRAPASARGRPLGSTAFIASLEQSLGRTLARRKPGSKAE
jgi:hypothetical protein